MTYMLELLVIVPLVLSFNAVLPLIPLIIIIILIAAAAGMTRGFSIFAFFGLDALMGITQGTGGGRAGKGVRSVNYNRSAGLRTNATKRVPKGLVAKKLKSKKLNKQDAKIRAMKEAMGRDYKADWRTKRGSIREGKKELKKTTKEYKNFLSDLKKNPSKMSQSGMSTKFPNTQGALNFATSVLGSSFILPQNNKNSQAALVKDYVKNKPKEYYNEMKQQAKQRRPLAVLRRRREGRMRDLKIFQGRLEDLYRAQNQKIPPKDKLNSNGITQSQQDEINRRVNKATFFAKHSFLGTGATFYRTTANTLLDTQNKILTSLYGKDYDSRAKGLINMVATGKAAKSSFSQKDQELYDLYKTYDLDKGGTRENVVNHMFVGNNYNPETKTLRQQIKENTLHNMFHQFRPNILQIGYRDKQGASEYKKYYQATYNEALPPGLMTGNKYYFDLVKTIKSEHTPPPLPKSQAPNVIRVMNVDDNGNPMYYKNGKRVEHFLVENHLENGISYRTAKKEEIEALRKYEEENGNKYLKEKYKNDTRSWHDIVYGLGESNSGISSQIQYDKEGSRKYKTGNYNDRRERDLNNNTTFNYNRSTYENANRMDMYNIKTDLLNKSQENENILKSHVVLSINKDKNDNLPTTYETSLTNTNPTSLQANTTKDTAISTDISVYQNQNYEPDKTILYTNRNLPYFNFNKTNSNYNNTYSNNSYSNSSYSHNSYSHSDAQNSMISGDPYSILGIEKSADLGKARKAYYKLALKYHPDASRDPSTEEKFKEIANAYETICENIRKGS